MQRPFRRCPSSGHRAGGPEREVEFARAAGRHDLCRIFRPNSSTRQQSESIGQIRPQHRQPRNPLAHIGGMTRSQESSKSKHADGLERRMGIRSQVKGAVKRARKPPRNLQKASISLRVHGEILPEKPKNKSIGSVFRKPGGISEHGLKFVLSGGKPVLRSQNHRKNWIRRGLPDAQKRTRARSDALRGKSRTNLDPINPVGKSQLRFFHRPAAGLKNHCHLSSMAQDIRSPLPIPGQAPWVGSSQAINEDRPAVLSINEDHKSGTDYALH